MHNDQPKGVKIGLRLGRKSVWTKLRSRDAVDDLVSEEAPSEVPFAGDVE